MNVLPFHPGEAALLYLIAIHSVIGLLAGCVFPVRALLCLVVIVLIECLVSAVVDGAVAGLWSLTGLVSIQIGYLGGIYARSLLERAGLAEPAVQARRAR